MTVNKFTLFCFLIFTSPSLLWAEEPSQQKDLFRQCPTNSSTLLNYSPPPVFSAENINEINVSAEQVQNIEKSVNSFTGNVVVERHLLRLRADQIQHNQVTQRLELKDNIQADTQNMVLSADSGWLNMETNQGELHNSIFYMPESHLTGKTPVFSITDKQQTLLVDTQFSTCPPEKFDWHLDTSWLELDHENSTGTAKHTVLWLKDIPVFYMPWIQFPLGDERRSGLLMPSIGSSNSRGTEVNLPFYWNITSNHDAILTPQYMSDRGTMLSTEYRYLTKSSTGQIDVEYLDNDKQLDEERYLIHFKNQSSITDNLSLSLLADSASDSEYLTDLGSNISVSNTTHLEKNANVKYYLGNWNAGLLAQSYQTIDQDILLQNRPYRRLPQVTLDGNEQLVEFDSSSLSASLASEWVEFEHESTLKEQGSRFHIYPRFSWPAQGNAWFFTPSAGFAHTQYDTIDITGNQTNYEDRNLGIASLDTGLFFERETSSGSFIQTLEPRLFYLNIPFEDQSMLPVFDTSAQNFTFSSFFRENRFNGIDRIGDANQLTVALSSRILEKDNGHELMSLNIGRIYYFDDQKVSLDNSINTADESDIITELSGNLGANWRARATYQWNAETDTSDKRSMQLNYAASDEALFNIGYRFHRDPLDENDNLEQTDISFAWPFATNYSLLSRWNYSITEERNIEALVGIEYESCCWAVRLISQRYLTDDTDEPYDSSIMFQFVLKGFGSVSDKQATSTLKHAILGYQPDY